MSEYQTLLKSPLWQRKRLEILNKFDSKGPFCMDCQNYDVHVHVHHGWYEKGKKPWEYPDSCFRVLCDTCHKDRHEIELNIKKLITSKSYDYLMELSKILKRTSDSPESISDFNCQLISESAKA